MCIGISERIRPEDVPRPSSASRTWQGRIDTLGFDSLRCVRAPKSFRDVARAPALCVDGVAGIQLTRRVLHTRIALEVFAVCAFLARLVRRVFLCVDRVCSLGVAEGSGARVCIGKMRQIRRLQQSKSACRQTGTDACQQAQDLAPRVYLWKSILDRTLDSHNAIHMNRNSVLLSCALRPKPS